MKLKYKATGIEITADAFSNITNEIRYLITSPFADGSVAIAATCQQFSTSNNRLEYGGIVAVPNMSDMFKVFQIEQSDVGKSVEAATITWLINILYSQNLLNLNLADWSIVE